MIYTIPVIKGKNKKWLINDNEFTGDIKALDTLHNVLGSLYPGQEYATEPKNNWIKNSIRTLLNGMNNSQIALWDIPNGDRIRLIDSSMRDWRSITNGLTK